MSLAVKHYTDFFRFRPAEIKVFRKRRRLPGPQWMEKNVYVPIGSRQGLYRNANNPAMYGVLDWATRHHVRIVVMAKGIQVGGTLVFYGLLLREGEYTSDSALIVMADEKTVKKLVKKRLQQMIDKSAALASIKSDNPDDTTLYSITLSHGFTIDVGWASSEMSVSSESYRVIILDEISKYKNRGNIEDAKARATVFPDTCKIWIFSSPGIDSDDPDHRDPLMTEAEACDVMLEFRVKCPDCGGRQVMRFDRFRWPAQLSLSDSPVPSPQSPSSADSKAIRRNRSAWYECEHCGSRWNDYKRDKALHLAMLDGWQPTDDCQDIEDPQSVYIHFPSWLSPYVSLSAIVADWLEAQGDEEKLRKWHNRHAGVSYKYGSKKTTACDDILKFRSDLPRNLVPPDTARLALIVDPRQDSFDYQVWALGYAPEVSMHMVRHGLLDTFSDLEGLISGEVEEDKFFDHEGREYRITCGLIDSGGNRAGWKRHSRTYEVYEWCSTHRIITCLKGIYGRNGEMVTYKTITTFPGTNKPIPGGLKRINVRVDIFKDELERRLAKEPDDKGALSFHHNIDETFAKHFTGETKDAAGDWSHTKKSQRIDHFDCTNYALVLREMLKLKIGRKPQPVAISQHSEHDIQSEGFKRPSWRS